MQPTLKNVHLPCTAAHGSTDPLNKALESFPTLRHSLEKQVIIFLWNDPTKSIPKQSFPTIYSISEFPKKGIGERLYQ